MLSVEYGGRDLADGERAHDAAHWCAMLLLCKSKAKPAMAPLVLSRLLPRSLRSLALDGWNGTMVGAWKVASSLRWVVRTHALWDCGM